jgi:ferredoxin-like protein FixX
MVALFQCDDLLAVAPPGTYGDLATPVAHCPSGTYKETYARAATPAEGCLPCGTGLWLSAKNFKISFTDLYGQLLIQGDVRGSPESCCK